MNEVIVAAALQAACEAERWKFSAQLAPLAELKESPDILRRLERRRQFDR